MSEIWQENMMSKYYVAPTKKRKSLIKFLNIAFVLFIIVTLMDFLVSGHGHAKPLLMIVLYWIIIQSFKQRKESTGYYEVCAVTVSLDEKKIALQYEKIDKRIEFEYTQIRSAEYSDQLTAMKIIGLENISHKDIEHLFYMEEGKEKVFLDEFETHSGIQIHYMDR